MKYLFLISWLRAREKKLADNVDIDRMIGANSPEESFKVLNDTDYASYLQGESYKTLERVISKERQDFRKSLEGMDIEEELIDVLFLRDDLQELSKKAKNILFYQDYQGRSEKIENEILRKVKERSPEKPHEVDGIVLDIYFQRISSFLTKAKEKEVSEFFENYRESLSNESDLVVRDELLKKMEDEIIEKGAWQSDGFIPVLAFFIKKRRVENSIRTILSGKRIGLQSQEIYKLIKEKRAL